jgi:asparagine synthase (glutamine-hydrolysing)
MCGIAGFLKSKSLTPRDIDAVRRANFSMFHRGPDGSGEYCDAADFGGSQGHLFMAMRRLSIIDLAHGWQPLKNEDETIAVIVNGEIYNHVELRAELLSRGHRLRTNSDCEVLPHLYEDYGLDFVHQLRGMFAFALWDGRKRRLVLGRDRMGEKPLYLHVAPDGLWFASELKALLASGRIPFDLDASAIDSYLHYGWIPEPQTAVAGIHKLQAGHLMIVEVQPWVIAPQRCYWRVEDAPPLSGNPVELVRAELDTVGRLIVRSDVPIGVALSSGFDSSLAAALAVKNNASQVHAFSVGYSGSPGQDERGMATRFAGELGMKFHALELTTSDMTAAFPTVAFQRDDPIADIAGFGYHSLSKIAREAGCPVLLQGQGGDELLWGYAWTRQAVLHSLRKFAGNPVGSIEALLAELPAGWSRPQLVRFAYILGGLAAGWRQLSPGRHSGRRQLVAYDLSDPFQIGAYAAASTYSPRFRAHVEGSLQKPEDFLHSLADGCPVDVQMIALLCRGYLLENGLSQGDRLSMANSVELRLPLVDYRLAETLVGIQKHRPLYQDPPKQLLIEAARDLIPDYVVNRPKRGFNPPVRAWLAALRNAFGHDLMNGALVEGQVLDRKAAAKLVNSTGRFGHGYDLFFKYSVLEFWYRGMEAVAKSAESDTGSRARLVG